MNYKGTKEVCEQLDRFKYLAEIVSQNTPTATLTSTMDSLISEMAKQCFMKTPDADLERIAKGGCRLDITPNMLLQFKVSRALGRYASIDRTITNGKCLSAEQIYAALFQNVAGYETLSLRSLGKMLKNIAYDLGWEPGIDFISRNNKLCYRIKITGGLGNSGEWKSNEVKEGK